MDTDNLTHDSFIDLRLTNPIVKDLSGQRFFELLVIRFAGIIQIPSGGRSAGWLCLCDCGKLKVYASNLLRAGQAKSCGCLRVRNGHIKNLIHGCASPVAGISPEYQSWSAMKSRCYYPGTEGYEYYGGRGITVCQRLRVFSEFLSVVGHKPDPSYQIDRINTEGHYSCGACGDCEERLLILNVRWATPSDNMNNRRNTLRLTLNGVTKSAMEWSRLLPITHHNIEARKARGWSDEDTLLKPINKNLSRKKK